MTAGERRLCRTLAVLILLLALGAAALYCVPAKGAGEKADLTVTDISVGSVAAIAVKHETSGYGLVIGQDRISILDVSGIALSESRLEVFAYQLSHLTADRAVAEPGDLSAFGLDRPSAGVTLLLADGGKLRLYLGNESPLQDGWYLRREDTGRIYIVSDAVAQMMRYTVDDFRQIDLFPSVSAENFADFSSLQIRSGASLLRVECANRNGALYFVLTQPFQSVLGWQTTAEALLKPLAAIDPVKFVSETEPLSRYGLDTPLYELTVTYGQQTTRLVFAPADDTHYYCADPSGTLVVLVEQEDVSFLDTRPSDLMGASIYKKTAAETQNITVIGPDQRYSVDIIGQGMGLRGRSGVRELSQEEMVRLYSDLTSIPATGELKEEQALTAQSLLTLIFTMRNGTVDTIELIPVSDRRCAVVLNGESNYTTYLASATEILNAAAYFMGG